MRPALALALVCVLLAPVGVASAGGPPLVDAGLDQHVAVNSLVHLDAGGTVAPHGRVARYRWTVHGPDGTPVRVRCTQCERTTFRPIDSGRYVVTLAATGADGETATDTLTVGVGTWAGTSASGSDPALRLAGPSSVAADATATYRATATAGAAAVHAVRWRVDGRPVRTDRVSGRRAVATLDRRFAAGGHRINATVVDAAGRSSARAVHVTAGAPTSPSGGGSNTDLRPRSIEGPRALTGSAPFAATYRTNRTVGKYTWWYLDGRRVGRGRSVQVSLSPGRHDVHAERSVQWGVQTFTFPDGGTRVVADPGPTLRVTALHGGLALVANATADDPAGDLASLSLAVDGRQVDSVRSSGRTARLSTTRILFPGRHTVAVTAVDARGQRARRTATVRTGFSGL